MHRECVPDKEGTGSLTEAAGKLHCEYMICLRTKTVIKLEHHIIICMYFSFQAFLLVELSFNMFSLNIFKI